MPCNSAKKQRICIVAGQPVGFHVCLGSVVAAAAAKAATSERSARR